MHAREATRVLGSRIPWVVDGMDNALKNALGGVPNGELVLDPEGLVVARRGWSDPNALRADLGRLIGPVDRPTREEDLDLPDIQPPTTVPRKLVARLEVPDAMLPLRIEPLESKPDLPFYVKLRAEADLGFYRDQKGSLYLGFHLDPIYKVHWNNEAAPLEWELETPQGVAIDGRRGIAPLVGAPADADPREFLRPIEAASTDEPLLLTARYYACDDAQTFCVPATQTYRIHLERDRDGGSTLSRLASLGPAGMVEMMDKAMQNDADGDGRLSRDEAPDFLEGGFVLADRDGDGYLTRAEAEEFADATANTGRD
jgi:hypothetical protein